jgi:hypothetical protein
LEVACRLVAFVIACSWPAVASAAGGVGATVFRGGSEIDVFHTGNDTGI